jgi:hypothetical protein
MVDSVCESRSLEAVIGKTDALSKTQVGTIPSLRSCYGSDPALPSDPLLPT